MAPKTAGTAQLLNAATMPAGSTESTDAPASAASVTKNRLTTTDPVNPTVETISASGEPLSVPTAS